MYYSISGFTGTAHGKSLKKCYIEIFIFGIVIIYNNIIQFYLMAIHFVMHYYLRSSNLDIVFVAKLMLAILFTGYKVLLAL